MPKSLIECVPNFSEARRPEVVEEILAAIKSVPGVQVLDHHSDLDHNRTVITFVGDPDSVEEAAFQAIAKAAERIDLDTHSGEHPRIGATDVVPFVPISGATLQDCVEIARRLGERVGAELQIPVYLYEEAATRPERKNLENIRRGEYESLMEEIGSNPERQPDFGPARLGKAGATVIGARPYLIAFNVYLTTEDVSVANRIARAVRHSSGGLRYVKALGLLVEGRAQVSMNLTDYRKTPLARVVELIRREAERYGVAVHHSELVGLMPQEALEDAAVWYLQLDQFEPEQVLERKLYAAREAEDQQPETASDSGDTAFLQALSAGSATPGGGSASAYAGAMAAALAAMVARLTVGRKKYAGVESDMNAVVDRANTLQRDLSLAVREDARAFEALMQAFKLPKESQEEQDQRQQAIQSATLRATHVPLNVAEMSLHALWLAAQVVAQGNLNAITDGGTAAFLAIAAIRGAGLNVRINLASLEDASLAPDLLNRLTELEAEARQLEKQVRASLTSRGGLSLE